MLAPTSGYRGIGIAFDASSILPAETYNLSLDIISFTTNSTQNLSDTDVFQVDVFTGSGFIIGQPTNAERLILDSQAGELRAGGQASQAVSTSVASRTVSLEEFGALPEIANVANFNFEFVLEGDNANADSLVIFLGAATGPFPFPFPQITIDNISLTVSVPEPSSAMFLSLSSLLILRRKR